VSNHAVRNSFVTGAALLLSILIVSGESQAQTNCQTELGTSSGFTSVINGGNASAAREVDEWDGEVLKLTTTLPGVFTIEGNGPGLQSAVYTDASSGPYPMLDSAQVGTSLPGLQVVVPAGDHCIQVTSGVGDDDFEIQATFTDICHLEGADDHGDSSLCATPLTLDGGSVSGQISSFGTTDIDRFKFYLGSQTDVVIASTGSTNVEASLYEADGTLVSSDDDSGTGDNFQITESLSAGWYYVRVKGANGSYSASVATAP
jgi:hypothetical protein